MASTGGEPTFAFDHEDLDLLRASKLERERLARRRRHPVPGRTRIELEEQGPPRHLRVSR